MQKYFFSIPIHISHHRFRTSNRIFITCKPHKIKGSKCPGNGLLKWVIFTCPTSHGSFQQLCFEPFSATLNLRFKYTRPCTLVLGSQRYLSEGNQKPGVW